MRLLRFHFYFFFTFFQKVLDIYPPPSKCEASRRFDTAYRFGSGGNAFLIWRCVSLKPVNIGGHSAYQDRVLTQLRKYYPNAASLSSSTWQVIDKFWNLNLSQVDELMKDRYSVFGPEPSLPAQNFGKFSILFSSEFCQHGAYLFKLP